MNEPNVVRMPEYPWIWFHRGTCEVHCDRCGESDWINRHTSSDAAAAHANASADIMEWCRYHSRCAATKPAADVGSRG